MPLLATIFVRQHSSKKLAFPAGFATASLPLKAPLLTSATPIQPHSPAQSYFRYETITIQRWACYGKTLLPKHRLFQPLFLLLTKVQTAAGERKKNKGWGQARDCDRATDKKNDNEEETTSDGEQHRGAEKEKEVSGGLPRDGGGRGERSGSSKEGQREQR